MSKLILPLAALTFWITSCNKKGNFREDAQIVGYDATKCACCGGFMIRLQSDNAAGFYLSRTLPADAGINPMSTFPVSVELDYEKNDEDCDKVITVTRVRKK